jgi:hypothetical protein
MLRNRRGSCCAAGNKLVGRSTSRWWDRRKAGILPPILRRDLTMPRFTSDQLAFAATKQRYSQDQFTYRDDPTRAMERSMINLANLALKAVRIYARREELEVARGKGTGPDILDVVSPVLVG